MNSRIEESFMKEIEKIGVGAPPKELLSVPKHPGQMPSRSHGLTDTALDAARTLLGYGRHRTTAPVTRAKREKKTGDSGWPWFKTKGKYRAPIRGSK